MMLIDSKANTLPVNKKKKFGRALRLMILEMIKQLAHFTTQTKKEYTQSNEAVYCALR